MKKEIPEWGKQCKVKMILSGMTLQDVSDITGYSRTYISAVINGRMIVPQETIKRITAALKVSIDND